MFNYVLTIIIFQTIIIERMSFSFEAFSLIELIFFAIIKGKASEKRRLRQYGKGGCIRIIITRTITLFINGS